MKKKRIGNDIRVIWEMFENNLPFALEGKSVKLYLKESQLRHEITDFSVKENSIEWIFYGKNQKMTGVKSLELVINEEESGMITTDACRFVELVACSCQESGSDENGVITETISLKSTISVENGGASIVVDTELSETSTNAIANAIVTQELKKKVNKTDLATINGKRIDEGGNIKIEGGSYDDTEIREELTELSEEVGRKQDSIADLEDIRSGAEKGATAIQEVKTINNQSIVGSGNIEINSGSLTAEEVASTEPTPAFPQVLYTEQSLTEEQKSQARTNIGVDDAIEEAIFSAITHVLNEEV